MFTHRRKHCYIVTIIMFQIIYFAFFGSKSADNHKIYDGNWRNLSSTQISKLSVLGRILFNGESVPEAKPRNFTILIWNDGPKIETRHLYRYGETKYSPWEGCTVDNCHVTYSRENFENADAVLFPVQFLQGVDQMPVRSRRSNFHQLWVVLTDESPYNTFRGNDGAEAYNGLFNWTMTYRMDSDVPVPYGRTVLTKEKGSYNAKKIEPDYRKKQKQSDVYVVIIGSNCGGINRRWNYVHELMKYIPIDVYGKCGPLECNGTTVRYAIDCSSMSKYEFYLSFENSNCDEYITEKTWWHAYSKNLVPIIMGTSIVKSQQLLPPKSYIHVDEFETPERLARRLKFLHANPTEYNKYFEWKNQFIVLNEHGYFGSRSYHYCRLCEALNYNRLEYKVYDDLESFWGVYKNCKFPTWNGGYIDTITGDDQTFDKKVTGVVTFYKRNRQRRTIRQHIN